MGRSSFYSHKYLPNLRIELNPPLLGESSGRAFTRARAATAADVEF